MNFPSTDEFAQLRRGLPVIAAVLFVVALLFPMWQIIVTAVQYPGEPLPLYLYAYPKITGNVYEVAELNQYVGFYYPDPVLIEPNFEVHPRAIDVPEWSLGPLAFVGVSLISVFVAVAPTVKKLKKGLKWQLIGTIAVFTVMLADIQYRLYQAGHTLDPDAPVMGVEGFTPPIVGTYKIANITSYSGLGTGAYMSMAAIGLLVVAYYYRDSAATFGDIPTLVRGGIEKIRRRIGSGDESEAPAVGESDEEAPVAGSPGR